MDDDQQFCLRWNNHQSTLVAVFDTLLENGILVDCTLAAEGKCLNAHKVVLSACSPFFEELLSRHYDKHPILILKDVKFQELKCMMEYMYRGEVNISQDQLGALLKAAESLQVKGLSDSRKGESKSAVPVAAKSPQPAIPKVQGLSIERRTKDDTREGSISPGPRKKKRMRRKSEEIDNHHDAASNSSESHHSISVQQQAPAQNIPLPIISKIVADVPEPIETKSDILLRHKQQLQSDEISHVPIKKIEETHTELMLEPKAEYVDEMNEDSIEDLTLEDEDDMSNMESLDDGAGPSHGNAGEGSSQGFGTWHMGNQSQDEVFLAAQEAVGAHRDSQAPDPTTKRGLLAMILGKLGQMAAVQERHSTMLAAIIEKIACNDSQPPPEGLPELPLQNVEDFCKCDEMLASNPDIYTYLRKRLSSVGGKTPTILAKNIMKGLLTNDIGRRFNWAGKDKFAFKDTTAKKMIFDAVYRVFENHSSDELNDVAISGALKTWLKMAPARYEYNLKRTFPKS